MRVPPTRGRGIRWEVDKNLLGTWDVPRDVLPSCGGRERRTQRVRHYSTTCILHTPAHLHAWAFLVRPGEGFSLATPPRNPSPTSGGGSIVASRNWTRCDWRHRLVPRILTRVLDFFFSMMIRAGFPFRIFNRARQAFAKTLRRMCRADKSCSSRLLTRQIFYRQKKYYLLRTGSCPLQVKAHRIRSIPPVDRSRKNWQKKKFP